jgi:hypothetical protein
MRYQASRNNIFFYKFNTVFCFKVYQLNQNNKFDFFTTFFTVAIVQRMYTYMGTFTIAFDHAKGS